MPCRAMRSAKEITAEQAAGLVPNGATLATGGFVGIGVPEQLLIALEARHAQSGGPTDLTLLFAAGQG